MIGFLLNSSRIAAMMLIGDTVTTIARGSTSPMTLFIRRSLRWRTDQVTGHRRASAAMQLGRSGWADHEVRSSRPCRTEGRPSGNSGQAVGLGPSALLRILERYLP